MLRIAQGLGIVLLVLLALLAVVLLVPVRLGIDWRGGVVTVTLAGLFPPVTLYPHQVYQEVMSVELTRPRPRDAKGNIIAGAEEKAEATEGVYVSE